MLDRVPLDPNAYIQHQMHWKLRPVHVEGHHESWDGWFHTWAKDPEGNDVAILETKSGMIVLKKPYFIRFTDREQT